MEEESTRISFKKRMTSVAVEMMRHEELSPKGVWYMFTTVRVQVNGSKLSNSVALHYFFSPNPTIHVLLS
jgi:hypothetical protein